MAEVATQSPSLPATHHYHPDGHTHAAHTHAQSVSGRRKSSHTSIDDSTPSKDVLAQCRDLAVFDHEGNSRTFGSLYSGSTKHMVVFVRHFLCGICQDFLRSLNSSFTPEDLAALDPPVSLSVIGCGQPEVIDEYVARTNCRFPIYADPSRKLYDLLGMTSTLAQGSTRPDYQISSMSSLVVQSIVQGLTSGTHVFKGGNFSQIGGEFLLEKGVVTWCHRMRNTRDHTSIPDLRHIIGLD